MIDTRLAAVRALHVPDYGRRPNCEGCNPGQEIAHAGNRNFWPCRTANIIFTPEEIKIGQWLAAEKWMVFRAFMASSALTRNWGRSA